MTLLGVVQMYQSLDFFDTPTVKIKMSNKRRVVTVIKLHGTPVKLECCQYQSLDFSVPRRTDKR